MSYVSSAEAKEYYNVHAETLRDWANKGQIEFKKTAGGHRRYKLPEKTEPKNNRKNFIYARVSSKKQEPDLQRQIKYLRKRYPSYEVISDIGSGLNFKRQGFRKILELLFKNDIGEVIVSSSDRFSRFGAREFFGWLFEQFGSQLIFLNNKLYENPNEELSEDLMEIITVFTARYHGRRKYSDNTEDTNLSQ